MNRVHFPTGIVSFSVMLLVPMSLFAQMGNLHGSDSEYRFGIHAGNNFRTSFFNDGTWGGNKELANNWPGEWPVNSGHIYLVDGNTFVISEVNDNYDPVTRRFLTSKGALRHIQATVKSANIQSSTGDRGPDQATGAWWTFLPLPGFANPSSDKIAMAKGGRQWEDSWPPFWPDIADPSNPLYSPEGYAGAWNGYFGKSKFNADEESYFVADDYVKQEFPGFRPDTNDVSRGGLGIRMYVRGFQWAKGLVQDAVFVVSDLKNIGTYQHNKVVFGYKIGNNVGDTMTGGEAGDDGGSYNVGENLAWTWDNNGRGHASWGPDPTGIFGGCFLESPGNPFDGIDDDNDGINGSGPTITTSMFNKSVLRAANPIVIIDYGDPHYRRVVTTLADTLAGLGRPATDTLIVSAGGFARRIADGDTLQEIGDNLFDDNLNGVIDESRGVRSGTSSVINYLYVGHKYIDYFSGNGADNLLIDERRDDGIDNDGNWIVAKDDVGADGVGPSDRDYPGPDRGEGDGIPTNGEPHFDKVDINESDMIGLTSFNLYTWGNDYAQYDDEKMWQIYTPGSFQVASVGNVELGFGAGYFPLPPGYTERFSMGLIAAYAGANGRDTVALFREKQNVAKAYYLNYNFAKAPDIPVVKAYVGDHKVTLFWDKKAEESVDPISNDPGGRDFEGYKIYRSTDPGWNDAEPITDMYGGILFRKPIAQFDLANDKKGPAGIATQGVHFDLGNDTGLRHYWVDTNVVNGTTYYYAVTAYDHGDEIALIDPSECSKFIAVQQSGEIQKGTNVVAVRPEAPSAGYVRADVKDSKFNPGPNNTATGSLEYTILNPQEIKDNHVYRITFRDTLSSMADSTRRTDSTKSFTLVDITSGDTVAAHSPVTASGEGVAITDGFQLSFADNPSRLWPDTTFPQWNRSGIMHADVRNYYLTTKPPVKLVPGNFEILFGDVGMDTSKAFRRGNTLLNAIPVNFTIMNTLTNTNVPFAFFENDKTGGSGKFTTSRTGSLIDQIIMLTPKTAGNDTLIGSWLVQLQRTATTLSDTLLPSVDDVLTIHTVRPFLSHDSFEFTTVASTIDKEMAKGDMGRIRVVPNPYVITNSWEPPTTYSSGRGERHLHFTHLPQRCTIRIFNIRGQLVKTLEHDSSSDNGTEIWNMLSKDNLEIAYGVYIFHVMAEGIGEKVGKIFVLK